MCITAYRPLTCPVKRSEHSRYSIKLPSTASSRKNWRLGRYSRPTSRQTYSAESGHFIHLQGINAKVPSVYSEAYSRDQVEHSSSSSHRVRSRIAISGILGGASTPSPKHSIRRSHSLSTVIGRPVKATFSASISVSHSPHVSCITCPPVKRSLLVSESVSNSTHRDDSQQGPACHRHIKAGGRKDRRDSVIASGAASLRLHLIQSASRCSIRPC